MQSPNCPTSKTVVKTRNSGRISVNFIVKNMVSEVKPQNSNLLGTTRMSSKGKLSSIGYCSEHSYFQELRCMDCKSWICAMCVYLHHKHCWTLLVKEACEELKKQVSLTVESETDTRKATSEAITIYSKELHKERKELIEEIQKKEKELREQEKCIEEVEIQKCERNKLCEKMKNLQNYIKNCPDNDKCLKVITELEDLLASAKKLEVIIPVIPPKIVFQTLKNLCEQLTVYVVTGKDNPLYGMVKVNGDQIWVSSFQSVKPKALLVPFKVILYKFMESSELPKKAFLKLTPEDGRQEEVEVVIETDCDSPSGRNFILLCSALEVKKYKGAKLIDFIDFASPFYRLHQDPLPKTEVITWNFSKLIQWEEGTIFGMNEGNSSFKILLEAGRYWPHPKIGVVVSGLQKLKEVNGRTLMIDDCGIVIA